MWRYIIAANVVILLFGMSVMTGISLWIPLIAAVLIGGYLGGRILLERFKARKGAGGIERALGLQADAFAKNVRPDQSGEAEEMRAQFMKELGALKASKLGGGGMGALYSLPWYMIIGPPGAGKSTALRNSGLNFPSKKGAVRGIGGTRNCDWWLSNEAVILDTAGRYATEDEDRDEWGAFLDTIKKNRKKKSINGLIVAVSITDIGGHSEEEVSDLGKRIRERCDEVSERLEMVFPIYLLFTKFDLLPGFIETFGQLKKADRAQIWGATFPLDKEGKKPRELFDACYQELTGVVHERMFGRLEEERRPELREKIYQFPQQLAALATNLGQFVDIVFADDVYKAPPLMRGVYLSSGTQEGRPVDMLTSGMMEAFGVSASLEQAAPQSTAKSYFLGDMFSKVMFPDKEVAARSARGKTLFLFQRSGVMAGIVASALLLTFLPLSSFRQNASVVDSTKAIIEAVVTERERNKDKIVPPSSLESLRSRLRELKEWEAGAPPLAMRYGMFQGGTLFPFVQKFYIQTLQKELLDPILKSDAEEMKTLPQVYGFTSRPSDEEYKRFFDKLKLHLLLTPHGSGEPDLEPKSETELWIVKAVSAHWAAGLARAPDTNTENQMEAHIRFYLELLRETPAIAFARDQQAVKDARNMLNRVSYADAVIKQLVVEASSQDRDMNMRRIMNGAVTPMVVDRGLQVRAAFTKWAWENVVKERFEREGDQNDRWVFGASAQAGSDRAKLITELKTAYFAQYIEEWREFINAIRISQPPDVQNAMLMLVDLTKGEPPPMNRLFAAVAENTVLEKKASGGIAGTAEKLVGGLIERVKNTFVDKVEAASGKNAKSMLPGREGGVIDARSVEEAFRDFVRFGSAPPPEGGDKAPKTLPIDLLNEQLSSLAIAAKAYVEDPRDASQLLTKIQGARTALSGALNQMEIGPRWRGRIESFVWSPIDFLGESLVVLKADISRKWCGAVVSPYIRSLKKRYPLDNSKDEATIADVTAFFAPKTGILWAFYQSDLAADVLQNGSKFKVDTRMAGMLTKAYDGALVPYLQEALSVTNSLFPPGSAAPRVDLDVRIQASAAFSSITLEVGGTEIDYRGGPERFKRMSWPSAAPAQGATLRLVGRNGVEDSITKSGEWGLFRLLESGSVVAPPKGGSVSIRFQSRQLKDSVTIDFKVAGGHSDLFSAGKARKGGSLDLALGNLTPPFTIARGSPTCNP